MSKQRRRSLGFDVDFASASLIPGFWGATKERARGPC